MNHPKLTVTTLMFFLLSIQYNHAGDDGFQRIPNSSHPQPQVFVIGGGQAQDQGISSMRAVVATLAFFVAKAAISELVPRAIHYCTGEHQFNQEAQKLALKSKRQQNILNQITIAQAELSLRQAQKQDTIENMMISSKQVELKEKQTKVDALALLTSLEKKISEGKELSEKEAESREILKQILDVLSPKAIRSTEPNAAQEALAAA